MTNPSETITELQVRIKFMKRERAQLRAQIRELIKAGNVMQSWFNWHCDVCEDSKALDKWNKLVKEFQD